MIARIVAALIFFSALSAPADTSLRIVTLAPSAAEWVMEFGVDPAQVVGVAEYTDFPESLKGHPTIGPYQRINLEKVLSLKPTLVVATRDGNIKEQVDRLTGWGIPVALLDGQSLKTIRESIDILGKSLRMPARARELTDAWDREVAAFQRSKAAEAPMVFVELGQNPWITVGRSSFIREAIELAGGFNWGTTLPGNASYPKIQFEKILQANPDWVLIPLMPDTPEIRAQFFKSWSRYPALKAVKNKQVCLVTWNELMRPVRRLLAGASKLAALLKGKKAEGAICGP